MNRIRRRPRLPGARGSFFLAPDFRTRVAHRAAHFAAGRRPQPPLECGLASLRGFPAEGITRARPSSTRRSGGTPEPWRRLKNHRDTNRDMNTNILALACSLSDQDLIARVGVLAGKEREATVELVAHLAVLDARPALLPPQATVRSSPTARRCFGSQKTPPATVSRRLEHAGTFPSSSTGLPPARCHSPPSVSFARISHRRTTKP